MAALLRELVEARRIAQRFGPALLRPAIELIALALFVTSVAAVSLAVLA